MATATQARKSFEETAMLALEFGGLLMEAGASAHHVEEIVAQVAVGLGADRIDLRVGYASLSITIGIGPDWITRMRKVGPLGVNQRLYHALREAASRIAQGSVAVAEARSELHRLLQDSRRHPDWVVAMAVGVACAAFGRLLSVDWAGVAPIFVGAVAGQMVRRLLALRYVNVFVSAAMVAFLGSVLTGLGARWIGSQTVARDMVVPVLLLVPGVPALNAQIDILDGDRLWGAPALFGWR